MDDPESDISKLRSSQDMEILHPGYELNPGVCYVGLPKRFIAGEVILGNQRDECAEGISVTLVSENGTQNIKTDNFGDFEFEGLEHDMDVVVKIEHGGYSSKEFSVKTRTDINLGEIVLDRM
jgi:hypothetical protein